MAENNKELKPQNVPRLALFFGLNVAVLLILADGQTANFTIEQFVTTVGTMQNGVIVLVTSLAVIVLDGLVPERVKEFLVFLRLKHPLPGSRAFTEIAPKYPEYISLATLKRRIRPWPTEKQAARQNKLWLDLSVKYGGDPAVSQAHRSYLLTKEMTSLSMIFVPVFAITLYLLKATTTYVVGVYAVALFMQLALVALASRNYGTRLVIIVLSRAAPAL